MPIYDQLDLTKAIKSTRTNQISNLNSEKSHCRKCGQLKHRKGGTYRNNRFGWRLFYCAECK